MTCQLYKIADADQVHPRGPQLGVSRQRGEDHKAAVASAIDRDARRVDLRLCAQPIDRVREIGDRVHPFFHVVKVRVGFAITGRAAHVRREHRITARDQVLNDREKDGL